MPFLTLNPELVAFLRQSQDIQVLESANEAEADQDVTAERLQILVSEQVASDAANAESSNGVDLQALQAQVGDAMDNNFVDFENLSNEDPPYAALPDQPDRNDAPNPTATGLSVPVALPQSNPVKYRLLLILGLIVASLKLLRAANYTNEVRNLVATTCQCSKCGGTLFHPVMPECQHPACGGCLFMDFLDTLEAHKLVYPAYDNMVDRLITFMEYAAAAQDPATRRGFERQVNHLLDIIQRPIYQCPACKAAITSPPKIEPGLDAAVILAQQLGITPPNEVNVVPAGFSFNFFFIAFGTVV